MKLHQRRSQKLPVKMRIDLRSCDGFVAEHYLDSAEIGAALYEMGGETVAESVGGDGFFYSGLLG